MILPEEPPQAVTQRKARHGTRAREAGCAQNAACARHARGRVRHTPTLVWACQTHTDTRAGVSDTHRHSCGRVRHTPTLVRACPTHTRRGACPGAHAGARRAASRRRACGSAKVGRSRTLPPGSCAAGPARRTMRGARGRGSGRQRPATRCLRELSVRGTPNNRTHQLLVSPVVVLRKDRRPEAASHCRREREWAGPR